MVHAAPRWIDYQVPDTLPDDTEESVVGTQWHQEAIAALAEMLDEIAVRRGTPWGVCDQVALAGLRRADGRPYDPRPDVMVLPRPLPSGSVSTIALTDAGVPLFVAEVASRSTVGDDVGAKRDAYEAIGVPEYVVYDPDGALLSPPLRAWRLEGNAYVPWRPEPDGAWRSAILDISLLATQPLLGIRDRDGHQIDTPRRARARLREAEERARLSEQRARLSEQRARLLEDELRRIREGRDEAPDR